jgi:DNA-binding response OmpR family regulator
MAEPPPRPRALVVEDEAPIRELLRVHLDTAGYDVHESGNGAHALRLLREERFDLVVLDVMLPGLDGVSVCRALRASGPNSDSSVLMVTARDGESDTIVGLESGADDYLAKPFGIRELLARVGAITRRHQRARSHDQGDGAVQPRGGVVQTDPERRIATVRGQSVDLTRQEFDLLHRLVSRPGIVFSRAMLLQSVWSDDAYVTDRTVDTVISRLRRKIEQDPQDPELILTAWGVGYKFADGSQD